MTTATFNGLALETCPVCKRSHVVCDWCSDAAVLAMFDAGEAHRLHDHACLAHAETYAATYRAEA